MYDAEIGRFLSADPFVQDGSNLQALNRYSYVLNNPLSYTDPSGYFLSGLKSFVKKLGNGIKNAVSGLVAFERKQRRKILRKIGESQILSVAVSIGLNFVPGCQGWCTMVFNSAMADANGGTIAQILTGAAIGAMTSGVPGGGGFWQGGLTGRWAGALGGKALANVGATLFMGGALAKAQGGKFIDGVKGATVGAAIGYGISRIMSAVAEPASSSGETASSDTPLAQRQAEARKALEELATDGSLDTGKVFTGQGSLDAAAKEVLNAVHSLSEQFNVEVGGRIVASGDGYSYEMPVVGDAGNVHISGFGAVAGYH